MSFVPPQSDQQLDCALDLMRRLPPQQIEKNLSDLIDLVRTFFIWFHSRPRHTLAFFCGALCGIPNTGNLFSPKPDPTTGL